MESRPFRGLAPRCCCPPMAGRNQIAYRAFGHIPGEGIGVPPPERPHPSAAAPEAMGPFAPSGSLELLYLGLPPALGAPWILGRLRPAAFQIRNLDSVGGS